VRACVCVHYTIRSQDVPVHSAVLLSTWLQTLTDICLGIAIMNKLPRARMLSRAVDTAFEWTGL